MMTTQPTTERLTEYATNVASAALDEMNLIMAEVRASGDIANGQTAALVSSLAQIHESAVRVRLLLEAQQ